MEDLSFSVPFEDNNELFSFFFEEGEQPQVATPLPGKDATTTFKDPNAPTFSFDVQQPTMEDFSIPTDEQFPSLFPMLDQLKMEPVEVQAAELSSPCEFESMDVPVKTRAKGRRRVTKKEKEADNEKPAKPAKRNATERKNSKRPTKKQKVEKTSFIASLKGLTSTELEQMAETQPLSAKEQSDLKKYIRMIKNRESAQLSRERRKIYQDTLERALATESARNASLKQQIIELEAENKVLQREFLEFKSLIENSNLGKAFSSFADNNAFKYMTKSAAAGDNQAQATFAMYLLIVLHAFGQQLAPAETLSFLTNPSGGPVEAQA